MHNKQKILESLIKGFIWFSAIGTVMILLAIMGYIVIKGIGFVNFEFLTSTPKRMGAEGGIFPIIVGTFYFVTLTMAIATPIGVGAAIYLSEYTRDNLLTRTIRFTTELLAGVPSIIFGLFGYAFFVILLKEYTGGWSLISGALTATCMILPILIRASEEALKTVPKSYREGSFALGATKWQTVYKVVLPTAIPGILTGIILSIGRAVGETAALLLTLGGSLLLATSMYHGTRTLPMHLYMVAMETGNMDQAFATGVVLLFVLLFINLGAGYIVKKIFVKNI